MKFNNILILGLFLSFGQFIFSQNSEPELNKYLSFSEYLNQVGKSNLSYLAEKYNVNIADAEVVAQKVLPDPEIQIEATKEVYSLGLGYTLELGNKRGARVKLAKSQAELERLALEYYYQELRAEATEYFLEAIKQLDLLNIKKQSYEYMLQFSQSDSIRFRLGEITEIDARQSKLEAATLLNDVFEQEAEFKSALASLNQYMGLKTETLSIPIGSWNTLDRDYILSDLISAALINRIDLLAAKKSSEIATNQLKLIKAERKIDLGITISYERDWDGFLPSSNTAKAGLSVPLKFSNTNKGAIKASQYGIEQSRLKQQNSELQIQTEVSQAFFYFEAAKKKVKQYKSGLLDDSRKILQGMEYKYKRGETSIMEVLIAQRTYNDVQEQYIDVMKGYVISLVNLQKACGIWDIEI